MKIHEAEQFVFDMLERAAYNHYDHLTVSKAAGRVYLSDGEGTIELEVLGWFKEEE